MVSRTPTKQPLSPLPRAASGSPTKPTPSPSPSPASARRRRVLRRGAPEDQVARRNVRHLLRGCRRRLLKLFARLAVLGSPPSAAPPRRLPPPPLPAAVAVSSTPKPNQVAAVSPQLRSRSRRCRRGGGRCSWTSTRRSSTPRPTRRRGRGTTSPCAPSSRARRSPSTSPSARGRRVPRRGGRVRARRLHRGPPEYASPVLDRLDPRGALFAHRLYRGACRDAGDGRLVKDLAATGRDLRRAVIVDDNPNAYSLQPDNAVPVAPFIDDADDHELERVMGILSIAAEFDDVRDAIKRYKEIVEAS